MKYKVTDPVRNYKGEPVKIDEDGTFLTWRDIIFRSLNSFTNNENPTTETKQKCYQITKKVYDSSEPSFTPSEITFMLERIGLMEMPLVYGQAREFLKEDEPSEPKEVEQKAS